METTNIEASWIDAALPTLAPRTRLEVRFSNTPPNGEVFGYAQERCAALGLGPTSVVIRRLAGTRGRPLREVTLCADGSCVARRGSDLMATLREAFGALEEQLGTACAAE